MRPYLFEINDVGIRVARGIDEIVRSPGYASFVHNKVEIGERGHAHAWLSPRHSSNRYWHDLNTSPLHQFGKRVRHAGDLAYLHLEQLRERAGNPTRAIFITPSPYQREQLSLLLGIAQASGLAVTALIDSAAAAGASLSPGHYVYLEAALHHCTLTQIEVDTEHATRRHTEVIAGCGIVHFEQKMTACIVDAFLSRCRFDPLHDASTEQLLHTHLAEWLALLEQRPEITISIDYHGTRHETRIHRDALITAIQPLLQQIERRLGPEPLVLDHRFATVPGCAAHWPHAHVIAPESVFRSCADDPELQALPGDQGVSLRTTLAVTPHSAAIIAPPIPASTRAAGPTHLLINHEAYPITTWYLAPSGHVSVTNEAPAVCRVFRDGNGVQIEAVNGAQIALNGRVLSARAALKIGDHLTIPGTASLFIPIDVKP